MKEKNNQEYNHLDIEKKWQKEWERKKIYKTQNNSKKKKYYVLDMFPYPSGKGLHVGHPKGYIGSDVFARMKRAQGFNVLHPMGYDAFGLPAEQYALEHHIHPKRAVQENVVMFENQLKKIGFSYDWERKINTTDPEFFKWTQWIFLKIHDSWYNKKAKKAEKILDLVKSFEKKGNADIFHAGDAVPQFTAIDWKIKTEKEKQEILMKYRLAYEGWSEVNWCPVLGTVLANDEVVDSPQGLVSERGSFPVEKKLMRQWFLRITAYADRLLAGLDGLDWSENIKEIQRNWIGASSGLIFKARVKDLDLVIETFSAHFVSCYADTFFAIAPDHPLLSKLVAGQPKEDEILRNAKAIVERRDSFGLGEYKEIEGVFTGRYATDPLGNGDLPIWVASFALKDYGTGIVKCSAHDERDFAFAKKFHIPLKTVLLPTDDKLRKKVESQEICFTDMDNGIITEPKEFSGRRASEVKEEIKEYVTRRGFAKVHTTYKMHDAVFARQRYWGEPIPLKYTKNGLIEPLNPNKLPLKLPQVTSYSPTGTGESPLAAVSSWVRQGLETNTMPGWAGSSWYFLRYMDPKNKKIFADKKAIKYWKNVDMYVGGQEHATGHLLYARFWNMFLRDYDLVISEEPFQTLKNQGMILGADNRKMSKRWGNVINPDDIVNTYGADTLRVYEMFMGPFEGSLPWSMDNIIGSRRFLDRIWRLKNRVSTKAQTDDKLLNLIQRTVQKVTQDITNFSFNTAISSMMILINEMDKKEFITKKSYETLLRILSPFAPHITEELWHMLGHRGFLVGEKWPRISATKIIELEVNIVVQINGRVRAECLIDSGSKQDEVFEKIKTIPDVEKWIMGKEIKKVIYISNKLINLVVV